MQTSEHHKWKSLQLKAGGHFSLLIKLNGLDSHQGKRQPYISDGNRVEYPLIRGGHPTYQGPRPPFRAFFFFGSIGVASDFLFRISS